MREGPCTGERKMNRKYDALKLENQLCFPLYATARKVVALYTPYLKPLGLTYTQYILMMVLWEKDDVSVGELGEKLHLDTGTLTPVLKKLERDGYVVRERCRSDERIVSIKLTEKGCSLRESVQELPQKVGSCIPLSPQDARTLYQLLYQVLDSIK